MTPKAKTKAIGWAESDHGREVQSGIRRHTRFLNLEFDDIQGFVVRGFGHLGYALISISDVGRFQSWMEGELGAGSFTPASVRKQTAGLRGAIGFSATGLDKVAGSCLDADMLPPEFLEGMVQEHRSRLLSDVNENDPGKWRWGSNEDDAIDGAVMLFAADSSAVDAWLDAAVSDANGMRQIIRLRGHFLADKKEPFGFADGISQPIIDGTERAKRARAENPSASNFHVVSAGELILGIGYPLRSRDVNMLGWRTRHPIPKAGSTTRAP